jgi:DNA-directed RNA polymerase subunit RPC12/RpoP
VDVPIFIGPKIAKRKVVCRRCGREISKGQEYYVCEEEELLKEWIGFNPKWRVAAWRYPTRSVWAKRRRIVCPNCRAEIEEEREKREEEFEEKRREPITRAKELMIEVLKRAGGLVIIDHMIEEVAKKLAELGLLDDEMLRYPCRKALEELVEEGVVELIWDERLQYYPYARLRRLED